MRETVIVTIFFLATVVSAELTDSLLAWQVFNWLPWRSPSTDLGEIPTTATDDITTADDTFARDDGSIVPGGCGRAITPLGPYRAKRLAGATFAALHSIPWMVSLRIPRGNMANLTICGGVLIRVNKKKDESDIVLTTGRCNDRDYKGTESAYDMIKSLSISDDNSSELVEIVETIIGEARRSENVASLLQKHDSKLPDALKQSLAEALAQYNVSNEKRLYDLYAVIGSHFQLEPDGVIVEGVLPGREEVPVERVVYHPEYNKPADSFVNDIAVVKLARPVKFSDTIQPICMPEQSETPAGRLGIVAGWGNLWGPIKAALINEPSPEANALQYMQLSLLPDESCKNKWLFKPESMLCVDLPKTEQGPCGWDSGAPYFFTGFDGYTLYGIVGRNPNDMCGAYSSTTFTRVSSYVNWIEEQINELTSVNAE